VKWMASGEVPSQGTNAFISSSRGMTVPRGNTVALNRRSREERPVASNGLLAGVSSDAPRSLS